MTVALLVCFVMCPDLPQLHEFLTKTFHVPSAALPLSVQSPPTIQSPPCMQSPCTVQSPPRMQSPRTIQFPPSISNCDQPSTSTSIDCVGSVPEDSDSQHSEVAMLYWNYVLICLRTLDDICCSCDKIQTVFHIVDECLVEKFDGRCHEVHLVNSALTGFTQQT